MAVRHPTSKIGEYLLQCGARVQDVDYKDRSALFWAIKSHKIGIIDALLDAAGPRAKNDGSLHQACTELDTSIVRKLLDRNHDPNFPSKSAGYRSALSEICLNSPLHAQEPDVKEIMDILISGGANTRKHHGGKSILLMALDSKNALVVTRALLESWMWDHV